MRSETVPRRVSEDIFFASSDLSSKLIRGSGCASMRLIVPMIATFVLISAIQPGSAINLSYTGGTKSNAGGSGTPTANFSGLPNNGCSPETVTSSGTWPCCVSTCKANDISGPNAKFTIINHSIDRQNILSVIKLDINSAHKECKGSKLPGFEIGESS
jgi:hypothetical protein